MNPESDPDTLQVNLAWVACPDCDSLSKPSPRADLCLGKRPVILGRRDAKAIEDWVGQPENPLFRRNRTQVRETFPFLLPALSDSFPSTWIPAITAVIDSGLPLIEAIASILKVKRKTVRFLRGKELSLVGHCWADDPVQLFSAINAIPDHRRPKNAREWQLLNDLWQYSLNATLPSCHEPRWQRDLGWHLLAGFCAAGYDYADVTVRQYLHRVGCWRVFSEFVRSFGLWCERRAREFEFSETSTAVAMEQITHELLSHYSAFKLLELSERWHQSTIRNQAHSARVTHWPALLPDPVLCDGMMVVSLTDSLQLFKESESLNHCASTYLSGCLRGHSHILSIRDASGESASTVEITLIEDQYGDLCPMVVQHRSENNSEPTASCRRALSSAMRRLFDPGMQVRFRGMAVWCSEREHEIEDSLSHECAESSVDAIAEILPDRTIVDGMLERRLFQEPLWCSPEASRSERTLAFPDGVVQDYFLLSGR